MRMFGQLTETAQAGVRNRHLVRDIGTAHICLCYTCEHLAPRLDTSERLSEHCAQVEKKEVKEERSEPQ
ncbi:hypothetical protein O3P69_011476 [Scylla paramamosain]|uniref:Uncharacterized protein n=1 Tax=Scylla paramamosain TaxID=85552 RepID=A0AAW0T5N1_SCYPA